MDAPRSSPAGSFARFLDHSRLTEGAKSALNDQRLNQATVADVLLIGALRALAVEIQELKGALNLVRHRLERGGQEGQADPARPSAEATAARDAFRAE